MTLPTIYPTILPSIIVTMRSAGIFVGILMIIALKLGIPPSTNPPPLHRCRTKLMCNSQTSLVTWNEWRRLRCPAEYVWVLSCQWLCRNPKMGYLFPSWNDICNGKSFFESVWAKGSSNSEVCYTSSHLLIFIFTSTQIIFHTSSHVFTHLHTSSHIFSLFLSLSLSFSLFLSLSLSFSLLHIFSSSHLLIFTSSHLHIFTSLHLHIFSLALSLSLSLSLSPSCPLALLPSCPLSRSLSFFFFSLFRPRAAPTRRHEMATFSHEMRFDRQQLM